jgi:hypothetical protein
MRKTLLVLAVLGPVLAACARAASPGGDGPAPIEHPTGASDLVLGVDTSGGLLAPQATLTDVPSFSLFGDGIVVTQGVQIEIYPGPALPSLIQTPVTEDGVQTILTAAEEAGLLGPDATYGLGCAAADVGTTTFTVDARGSTHTISATGLSGETASCSDAAELTTLARFNGGLGELRSWLPAGSVGKDTQYRFSELRVYVQAYEADPSLTEPAIDWPLPTDLGTVGEPVDQVPGTRCVVAGGADLTTLMPDLRRANQLTPWRSGRSRYSLLLRPLLPDQHSC